MGDLQEIELLKQQISNLEKIVDRLEKGESKYVSWAERLKSEKAKLARKYFGDIEDCEKTIGCSHHTAAMFRETIVNSINRIVDATYKIKNNKSSDSQVKLFINTDDKLSEYLSICEFYYKTTAIQIFGSEAPIETKTT